MNGGEFMVVMIVAVVMIASIFKSRARFYHPRNGDDGAQAENKRLRDEVQELKDRIKVIERITVEKENSLSREIESLRDR
jgi:uncharacterized protein YlxW (UPF0749 family)